MPSTDGDREERFVEVALERRGVRCTARLLTEQAPLTCAAVWDALPLQGEVYHAKYARNEIYALLDPFAAQEPPLENPTVTPIPGDLCWFAFPRSRLATASYGYQAAAAGRGERAALADRPLSIDLALFYERNNLLINGDTGWIPGTVWGAVVEGLPEMAEACQDLWRSGALGETLAFRRR